MSEPVQGFLFDEPDAVSKPHCLAHLPSVSDREDEERRKKAKAKSQAKSDALDKELEEAEPWSEEGMKAINKQAAWVPGRDANGEWEIY